MDNRAIVSSNVMTFSRNSKKIEKPSTRIKNSNLPTNEVFERLIDRMSFELDVGLVNVMSVARPSTLHWITQQHHQPRSRQHSRQRILIARPDIKIK